MKKTIFIVVLGIIVGIALAACSHNKDLVSNHRYISEAMFEELGSGEVKSCFIAVDENTKINVEKCGTLLLIKKYSRVDGGIYKETNSILGSAKDLEVTESQIDRLL